jgi:hypothetical protein
MLQTPKLVERKFVKSQTGALLSILRLLYIYGKIRSCFRMPKPVACYAASNHDLFLICACTAFKIEEEHELNFSAFTTVCGEATR